MDISDCSFQELNYSKLFNTYLSNFQNLKPFFAYNPLDESDILSRADSLPNAVYKNDFITALKAYHEDLDLPNQHKQLQKLSQEDALAVVTGQQLGMYGGPLYTVYKIMTAILLARKYEKKIRRPVVPVFWLADEDHDFDEIAWAGIPGRHDFNKVLLNEAGNGKPVAEQRLSKQLQNFNESIKDELFETDFSEALWQQLKSSYNKGKTHAQAFAGLINSWFAGEGLLISGSNHPKIKKLLAGDLAQSIEKADELHDAIESQSKLLEKEYHRQVVNGDTNLFYLSKKEGRVKISKHEHGWQAGKETWSTAQLVEDIKNHPEHYSPNVFLRPVIQDKLLPNLGYVAGPGELAYYGQMKNLYGEFDLEMPPIFPRLCATLIESGISRIMEKLPFDLPEYYKRIEDLENVFIERTDTADLEAVFAEWKSNLKKAAENPLKVIDDVDPTLDGTVGKTLAGFENELDKLKGRVYRSIKQKQNTQIKRIEKIKVNLFPDGGLQERAVSPIYYMNKYGLDIWNKLLEEFEKQELDVSKHHLIRL